MEYVKLNDGLEIPAIGFGTFLIPADGTTYETVKNAIDLGIRHIDTAVAYFNEQEVGRAVKDMTAELPSGSYDFLFGENREHE